MKKITLLKLKLHHFQAMSVTINVDGNDLMAYADNGMGKTRIFSAFTYLLFGKDSLGRSDFSIKDLDASGNIAERGINHSVEADLDVDGEAINMKKVYREKWTRQRGKPDAEFSGHTTDYFINGVAVQEKIFKSKVEEIAGTEEAFRLVTSPSAFPALPWQKQRSILLEVVGDISDADVIASNKELAELPGILGKHSMEDHKAIVTSERSRINKEIEKIPIRIDECVRGIPDISGLDRGEIQGRISGIEKLLSDTKLHMAGVDTGGKLAAFTKQIAAIDADLQKSESDYYSKTILSASKLTQQISDAEVRAKAIQTRISEIDGTIARKQSRIDQIEQSLIPIREARALQKGLVFTYFDFADTTEDKCVTCLQSLPEDRVQSARKKARDEYEATQDRAEKKFNNDKANAIKEFDAKGINFRKEKEELMAEIEALIKEKVSPELSTGMDISSLIIERDSIRKAAEDYTLIPGHAERLATKAAISELIEMEKAGTTEERAILQSNVDTLQAELYDIKEKGDRFVRREAGEKRVKELKVEEKTLAAEYEVLDRALYLIDLFTTTKVALLTDKINGKFEMAKFILFETQINTGIKDVCEIKMGGVGYNSGLNNAGRIQVGLDVVRTLQRHYGISAPVFIDNRESVVKIPNMDAQVISLLVSEPDKELRVEIGRGATA